MSLHSSRLVNATVLLTLAAVTLAFSAPAFADRPTEVPHFEVFTAVNPCTGLEETVTVSGTFLSHFHGDQENHHFARTVTTSSGFVGRGTEVGILHERIFVINDLLTNDTTGERMSVHFLGIHDASGEFRVFRFTSECLGAE
jgi:hypothetical protein